MKKVLSLLTVLFVAGLFSAVSAQTILDFKIVNNTGHDLYGVYVSPANDSEWGKDILPSDILKDGYEVEVKFNDDGELDCEWDLKLTEDASEQTSVVISGVSLCNISVVTISYNEDGEYVYTAE